MTESKGKTKKSCSVDSIMKSMLDAAQKEFGKRGVYVAEDHEKHIAGIELVDPALEWFFDSNILPLGRMIHLAGARMSCKSAFAYDLSNQFMRSNGGAILIDTESKTSPNLVRQIVDDVKFCQERLIYHPTTTVEEWMSAVVFYVKAIAKSVDNKGSSNPILIVVDSLYGNMTTKERAAIIKKGMPSDGFTRTAMLVTRHLKDLTSAVTGLPVTVLYTNHLKDDLSDNLGYTKKTPGGDAPGLHTTYEIWLTARKRLTKGPVPCGFFIRMTMVKNSMGPTGRVLNVPYHWHIYQTPDETGRRRRAWFDWDWSLGDLCVRLQDEPDFKECVFNLEIKVSKSGGDLSSKIKCPDVMGEDKFFSYSDFGKALRMNSDFLGKFIGFFDIPNHQVVTGTA